MVYTQKEISDYILKCKKEIDEKFYPNILDIKVYLKKCESINLDNQKLILELSRELRCDFLIDIAHLIDFDILKEWFLDKKCIPYMRLAYLTRNAIDVSDVKYQNLIWEIDKARDTRAIYYIDAKLDDSLIVQIIDQSDFSSDIKFCIQNKKKFSTKDEVDNILVYIRMIIPEYIIDD